MSALNRHEPPTAAAPSLRYEAVAVEPRVAVASQCPVGYDGLRFTATAQPKEGERRVSVAATHPHLYHYTDAHAFRSDLSFCFVERSPTARKRTRACCQG